MMRPLLTFLLIGCHGALFAQNVWYAPDFRWDEELQTWLGLVNPDAEAVVVTVAGFDAEGQALGEVAATIEAKSKLELQALDLFESGPVAWVRITAEESLIGYVRYHSLIGSDTSLAPLHDRPGGQQWVAQVNANDVFLPRTVLVNTEPKQGGALLRPVIADAETEARAKAEEAFAIPDFGAPFQKTFIDYLGSFKSLDNGSWDTIQATGEAVLASIQHFSDPTGGASGHASLSLPRTPNQRMVFGAMGNKPGYTSHLVLVNTHPGFLPLEITVTNIYREKATIELRLEPFEKRIVNLADPRIPGFPLNADWVTVTPFEGGLIGHQLFGSRDGRRLAAVEAMTFPATSSVLPYTPSSSTIRSLIGLINVTDDNARFWIYGYSDNGEKIRSKKTTYKLEPREKVLLTTESLFGDKAERVAWIEAISPGTELSTYAIVEARNRSAMAAMQGVAVQARSGEVAFAEFENFGVVSLEAQGWSHRVFSDPERWPPWVRFDYGQYNNYTENDPIPGTFYSEHIHGSQFGYFHLGYDPLYPGFTRFWLDRQPDSVAYLSPFVEMPDYGPLFLSFQLRMFDPQYATKDSRFGLVWREEGSETWHWSGLTGKVLLDPPVAIADCWTDIQYRNQIVTVTAWLPFETQLPDSVLGKRIQIGMYYHFAPGESDDAPFLFVDEISVRTAPLDYSLNLGELGSGSFETEPPAGPLGAEQE